MIHQLVIVFVASNVIPLSISILPKFVVILVLSVVGTFGIYQFVIKPIPFLWRFFGGGRVFGGRESERGDEETREMLYAREDE